MTTARDDDPPWSGHDRGSREYGRILVALLGAGMATFAQLYCPQGVLPLLASDLRVDAAQASLSVSGATMGLAIGTLPWSLVSDRIGRVASMRISLTAATVLGLAMPWSPTFGALLVVRVLEGLALGGIPAIAVTYLGEEIRRSRVAVAAGTYVSGTTLGGLVGRLVAGPVAEVAGWRAGTFAVAILGAAATAVFFAATPRPHGFTSRSVSVTTVLRSTGRLLRDPRLLVLLAQGALLAGAFVAVYNYLAFRLEAAPFGIAPGLASLLFVAYLSGTVSARVAGGSVPRYGRRRVLLSSTLVMAAGVALTLSDLLPVVILGLVVMTAGFFGAHSIASGWSGVRTAHDRAQSASLYNLAYYTGSSVIGYVGGIAWTMLGWPGVVGMGMLLMSVAGTWAILSARE
ncbi:putative MFS family arabinose efflux permease [Clavibacter michiganensis]|uniref:MFS transporter n=1 Tax=Clavibacter michiganensis TaxID=28447 RepID=UPI00195B3F3C|nr:MFS transporter [Clavibacter michiganensis]MBM7410854.1 putative MFS family arabinose efflux permease [Clavibacter michiganensis]